MPLTLSMHLRNWVSSTLSNSDHRRGRDSGCPLPPAQTRACGITAHGSYFGCATQGWLASKSRSKRCEGRPSGSSSRALSRTPCGRNITRFKPHTELGRCQPPCCSPQSPAFPPPPPPPVSPPALFGSFAGTTPMFDSSPACLHGLCFWLSRADPAAGWPRMPARSPGSRACSFSTCSWLWDYAGPDDNSRLRCRQYCLPVGSTRSAPEIRFSKLNSRPVDASVYTSPGTSRHPAQDSRSRWFATPFSWGSFIPDCTPVYPGACAPSRSRLVKYCGINTFFRAATRHPL